MSSNIVEYEEYTRLYYHDVSPSLLQSSKADTCVDRDWKRDLLVQHDALCRNRATRRE